MQTGTIWRLRFCRRSWGLKIYFDWKIARFWKSHICSISWMYKKQTAVSHSSTEPEIISLDTGLRLDDLSSLELWDLIVSVLENPTQNHDRTGSSVENPSEICSPPHTIHKRKQSRRVINDWDNVDSIPSNVQSSHQEALLYVFEDNEAVIKMIIKGRSPTMRHVSRNPEYAWLNIPSNQSGSQKIQIKYIDAKKNQLVDILTKGNFIRDEWNHLLCLFNITHFSSAESRRHEGGGGGTKTSERRTFLQIQREGQEQTET